MIDPLEETDFDVICQQVPWDFSHGTIDIQRLLSIGLIVFALA